MPVTVIVYVPVAVPAPTLTVIVEEPPAVTEAGLKLTVVPAGWPLALRLTVCAEPVVTAVLIVEVPLPPCWTLTEVGLAAIEKSLATTPSAARELERADARAPVEAAVRREVLVRVPERAVVDGSTLMLE